MMYGAIAVLAVFNSVLIHLYFLARKRNDLRRVALIQPATTAVSIGIGLLSLTVPHHVPWFTAAILAGMAVCFAADILNVDMSNQFVMMRGLFIFFAGYLTYAVSAFILAGVSPAFFPALGVLWALLAALLSSIYRKKSAPGLFPYLALYGALIMLMAAAGIGSLTSPRAGLPGAVLLAVGLSGLAASDLEFAVSKYHTPLHFPYGPYLYAGGQLVLALSLSFIAPRG